MKKTYKNPTLTVVNIQSSNLMQISGGFGTGTQSGGSAAGREASFTDDWVEE